MIQPDTFDSLRQHCELPFFKHSLKAIWSEKGLLELSFQSAFSKSSRTSQNPLLGPLKAYLAGQAPAFDWTVNWDKLPGTTFQKKVWRVLCQIPPGQVVSYKEVAQSVGSPQAARAVGRACGQNPILLVIPCHRVVAQGHWGGYSGGGLEIKKSLLRTEGHSL